MRPLQHQVRTPAIPRRVRPWPMGPSGGGAGGSVAVGELVHDGPATPEQISLWLPTAGTVAQGATATCRYRPASSGVWLTGHPLFRVQPGSSSVPADSAGPVEDGFAWVIIDLAPGTQYVCEVTVTEGANSVVKTLTHTTRALPATAGAATKTANSAATIASQLATLVPGDVLEIANGNYTVNGLVISKSGTAGNPITIRGQSRTGVVITDTTGPILTLAPSTFPADPKLSNVIIENMTLVGSGVDDPANVPPGNPGASSIAINGDNSNYTFENITIRNIVATGIDRFAYFYRLADGILVYDCTATGNNQWTTTFFNSSRTWNDDGIHLTGKGNCAFNNTMTGFGDTFAYASHAASDVVTNGSAWGVHFYRNEIRNSCDDPVEVDHARRNVSWYDNRVHNSVNMTSLDPLYGGPWLCARNIYINLLRNRPHKWNDSNTGAFLYSNTAVTGPQQDADFAGREVAIWYQPNNGTQSHFGYRNNVHIYQQGGLLERALWLENDINGVMDWSHNSWYPDNDFYQSNGTSVVNYANLAAAQSGLPNVTPVFSGLTRRYSSDTISTINPWTTTITIGGSQTEVTATYLPTPAAATAVKNTGVAIANITDGFSGASPDRGAVISGRSAVVYGDRNNLPTALATAAASMASNAFAVFAGGGLSTRVAHPVTGTLVDPTEDGQAASGDTSGGPGPDGNKTAIDWAGKGCYDSQGKKVMWAGTGAFGAVANTPINTMALYDETTNTWSAVRSWTAGGETSSDDGTGHMYDGNCIDVTGRRFFKKKFSRSVYVRDLTTGSWSKITWSSGEPSGYGWDAGMDYIPGRDRLWVRGIRGSDNASALFEINPTTGAIIELLSGTTLGNDTAPSVCSFNPRAFSGAGGVFVGGSNAYTVSTSGAAGATPGTVQSNASGKPSGAGGFLWANGAHLCRDPVGDGWLYLNNGDGYIWRLTSAGVWSQRAQLPSEIRTDWSSNGRSNIVMVPIDAHGVVWIIGGQYLGANRAWLYRP
jgi:hypothetical protein